MTDFKLNSEGDLDISSGGWDLVGDDSEGVEQDIRIRFKSVQGDWFLNLNEGLPLFSRILIASPNEADVYEIFRAEADKVPGVLAVGKTVSVEPVVDSRLTVNLTFDTVEEEGQQLELELGI